LQFIFSEEGIHQREDVLPQASFLPLVFNWLQRKLPFLLILLTLIHPMGILLSG
jgi:hypothetical protein